MKKTKKAVSLILAFAMVLSAMLGCMTVSSFATEGQAGEGPKLVDYSIDIANDTKTEEGAEFNINLEFDQQIQIVDNWILSAFNIKLSGTSLEDKDFSLKSGKIADDGKTLILKVQGVIQDEKDKPKLVSGELEVSLKSNYYDAITDATGTLPVSDWTDIDTYVPTGLGFEKVETPDEADTVTFKMTGPALLRGKSSIQILVDGESVTDDPSGLVPIHTHDYLEDGNFVPVSTWVKTLCGRFSSEDYKMTQGTDGAEDQFTISATDGSDISDKDIVVRMFGYAAPNDEAVQTTLFKQEIAAAEERYKEISADEYDKVAADEKKALKDAIEQATNQLKNITGNTTALDFMKMRAALQSAVDGAQDNAIVTISATRSDGTVNLSLVGGKDWIDHAAVKLNGKSLTQDQDYTITQGSLSIKSTLFDTEGQKTPKTKAYTVTIESDGYADVSQEVTVTYYGSSSFTIRILNGNNNVIKSKTFTEEEIREFAENPKTGGKGIMYSTACSMTGSRAFKGDGAYLSALIEDAGFVEGIDFNPETTTAKFRTNDSNRETDLNDDPTVNSYFNMINTAYTELMADRYYFQDLYDYDSELYKTYAESAEVDQDNDKAVEAHNLKLREAMAKSDKVEVQSMIAYEFVEDPNVDLKDSPLTDVAYDSNLAADKCFRFLLGTSMVQEGGKELASTLNTTMRATYQLYGIDLVDSSYTDADDCRNVEFDINPDSAEVSVTDSHGTSVYPVDGKYALTRGETYTYTVSASGYVTKTGTYEVTDEASQTVTVSLSRESSGGGGSSTVEDPEKEYTVTFDTNGGSSVTKQTVVSGDKAVKPADPTKDGYEFAGWYADSGLTKAYDFSSKVTGSITLYAKWTEAEDDQPVQEVTFSDVPSDAWYAEYVSYLAGKGIVNGKTENTFAPDAQITRAEFVKIIAGVAGADISGSAASGFSDVASDAWYAPYVAWGVKNGIINGTSATTFNPNGNITREDMATIIKRYTDFAKFTLPTDTAAADFSDSAQISSYAADAVKAMQQANIINGKGDNTFAPKDNATRAEACKMLTVLMKMMEA